MSYTRFETELIVRPDDIDMNNHVHHSKYLDYVLAARYDQMGRCYGMAMEDFFQRGVTWFQKVWYIEYKREITLKDRVIIRTWIDSFEKADVRVGFQILKGTPLKVAAEGYFVSTMINLQTSKVISIPQWAVDHYEQFQDASV